jgi:tape measure domain-containing protein
MSRFNRQVRTGATAGMSRAGRSAGTSYGRAATRAVRGSGISRAMAAESQAGAAAATRAVQNETAKVVKARNRAADATGKVRVAEAKLSDLRASGRATRSQMVTAEERLASAQRRASQRAGEVTTAEGRLAEANAVAASAVADTGGAAATAAPRMSRFGRAGRTAMSGIRRGVDRLGTAVPAIGRFTSGVRSSGSAASEVTGRMGRMGRSVGNAAAVASAGFGRVRRGAGAAVGGVSRLGRRMGGGLLRSMRGVTGGMGPLIGAAGLIGLASSGIKAASSMESTQASLTGLYHSGKDAKWMMGQIKKLSEHNPISADAYADAAKSLAYMGLKGPKAVKVMQNLSDAAIVSGKGGEGLKQANNALLQMVNTGKVYAAQLNQMSQAGVPIFSGLAKHFNTNIANVRKMGQAGKIQVKDVLDVLQKGTGKTFQQTIRAAGQVKQTAAAKWKEFKNTLHNTEADLFGPLLKQIEQHVLPALQHMVNFVKNNQWWIKPLAAGLGILAVAIGVVTGVTWAYSFALDAIAANPVVAAVTAIVLAVAALAAGIVYLATKTKFFQTIWNGIKVAFVAVKNALITAFNAIKTGILAVWRFIKNHILTPIVHFFTVTIPSAARTVRYWVVHEWQVIKSGVSKAYNWVKNHILWPIHTFFRVTIPNAATWLKNKVVGAWGKIKTKLHQIWSWVNDHVFSPLKNVITNTVPNAFHTAVNAIGNAWDKLKSIAKKPVNFLIGTVYDNGIRRLWNTIAHAFHADKLKLPHVNKLASGGAVRGPGGPTADRVPAMLSSEEHVWSARETAGAGGHAGVARLRAMARSGGIPQLSIGGAIGNAWNWTKNAAKAAWDKASGVAKNLMHPIKWIKSKIGGSLSAIGNSGFAKLLKRIPRHIFDVIKKKIGDLFSFAGGMLHGGHTSANARAEQAYALSRFGAFGWGRGQLGPLIKLWNQESGWNPRIANPSSGAYGIPQALPASKLASAGADWRTNAATQINWGLSYIAGRYGSRAGDWAHEMAYNWYGRGLDGGVFTKPTMIGVGESGPERVDVTPLGKSRGGRLSDADAKRLAKALAGSCGRAP